MLWEGVALVTSVAWFLSVLRAGACARDVEALTGGGGQATCTVPFGLVYIEVVILWTSAQCLFLFECTYDVTLIVDIFSREWWP